MLLWSYWPLPTGGAEAQCRKLAVELRRQNVSCRVLTARQRPGDARRESDQGVDIRRLSVPQVLVARWTERRMPSASGIPSDLSRATAPSRPRSASSGVSWCLQFANCLCFMAGAALHLFWNRKGYDVLHVPNADWIAGYAGVLGAAFRKPVLCKAANLPPLKPLASWVPFRKLLEKHRRNIHFVALHEPMRDALISGGVSAGAVTLIPNGVVLPEEASDPSRTGYVLCAANFTQGAAHKGFDWLLNAWARVVQTCPEANLCLAGDGDAAEWNVLAAELGIDSSVLFPGFVQDHRELYGAAMLLVVPSRHEGVPNVLLEAQAWGLPAVVSDIPGNRFVIEQDVNGRIVPVEDVDALAAELLAMLAHPDRRVRMGRAARERVRERFSISAVAGAYRELYRKLLEHGQDGHELFS